MKQLGNQCNQFIAWVQKNVPRLSRLGAQTSPQYSDPETLQEYLDPPRVWMGRSQNKIRYIDEDIVLYRLNNNLCLAWPWDIWNQMGMKT